jgi:prepilin-type N-terminal cleavage/methylation domain-containing protein
MCSRITQRGFTLIELLVVIAIIAILASILFPVFQKAKKQAQKITCTSQVRQLAMAVQMYVQDNGNRYPGSAWNTAIETYVGAQKLFFCPADAANDKNGPISYGYSGLLVRTDGTGCNEAQLKAPTEVGCIADATPSRLWADGGGLIGGGALVDPTTAAANTAVELEPRHDGLIIGFCDGHARFFPGKQANVKDLSSAPGRAFYQAVGLGLLQNYGGGIQRVTNAAGTATLAPKTNTVTLGGDYATMPLIMAAAEVWTGYTGKWHSRGFKGSGDYALGTGAKFQDVRRAAASGHYVWGIADGKPAGAGQLRIGYDAFVFIVAKNTKLAPAYLSTTNILGGSDFAICSAQLQSLFADATYKGYSANVYQAYTYDRHSGSRVYAEAAIGAAIQTQAVTATDDADMVEKVAADPYGIGYCSAAFADLDKVHIVGIYANATDPNTTAKLFPSQNPKYRWLLRDTIGAAPGEFEYPLVRLLRVQYAGAGDATTVSNLDGFAQIFGNPEFQNGPLFKTSYWVQ